MLIASAPSPLTAMWQVFMHRHAGTLSTQTALLCPPHMPRLMHVAPLPPRCTHRAAGSVGYPVIGGIGACAIAWNLSYLALTALMLRRMLWHAEEYGLVYTPAKELQAIASAIGQAPLRKKRRHWGHRINDFLNSLRQHGHWNHPLIGAASRAVLGLPCCDSSACRRAPRRASANAARAHSTSTQDRRANTVVACLLLQAPTCASRGAPPTTWRRA
jgi:hypothetical protein